MTKPKLMPRWFDSSDAAVDAKEEADDTVIPRVDEARLVPRPANARKTWKERELNHRGLEQRHLHDSAGVAAAAGITSDAARLRPAADVALLVIEMAVSLAKSTSDLHRDAIVVLLPLATRGHHAKTFYYLRIVGALVADVAGISGAAISLGEIPANPFVLALGASIATVLAGFVGKDLRIWREALRRARPVEELTDDEKVFLWLFRGTDDGRRVVRLIGVLSGAVAVLVAVGIFALRDSVDGTVVGIVYGALAGAVALGSCISSWAYADEVADVLASIAAKDTAAIKNLLHHSKNGDLQSALGNEALSSSIREEWLTRGEAAVEGVYALKFRILSRNPGTVGHGPATSSVGLRERFEGEGR